MRHYVLSHLWTVLAEGEQPRDLQRVEVAAHRGQTRHLVRGALIRPDHLRRLAQPDQVTLSSQLQSLRLRPLLEQAQSR